VGGGDLASNKQSTGGALDGVQLTLVESLDELDALRRWLGERRPILALDIETTGLSLARDRIRLVQLGDAMSGWAIPWDDWRGAIKQILRDYTGPIVLQHAKFDAGFLIRDGVSFPWSRVHDTMFMLHLVDSMGPKSLKSAAALHIGPEARAGESSLRRAMAKNRWDYQTVPTTLPLYWGYGALDAVLTARLAEMLWPRVQPFRYAYDLELVCQRVLCEMELRGIRIDVDYCAEQRDALTERLAEVLTRLGDVNPNAPQQIIGALVAAGASLTKRTDKGQLSVDDEVLSALAKQGYSVAADVLEARSLRKILSSYFMNFLEYRAGDVLHPHINQLAARTGRMSVTAPALQTVPRQALVRNAFIPRDGHSLVLADYDNEELRVAAHFSGDETMLQAFAHDRDLHGETARSLFGEGYTREQRHISKSAMFAKAYGAGVAKFAQATGLEPAEAARVFRQLDETYPKLATAMAEVTNTVRERAASSGGEFGWVRIVDGRHLKVPADKPYQGFNYLVQGSCASVLKQTLVNLDLAGLGEFIVLPVHDEVIFDVPNDLIGAVVPEITQIMTREDFRAPLTVSTKVVSRWGDAYE
jgi:DNA polymerase-1